jgi:hypothetical protein
MTWTRGMSPRQRMLALGLALVTAAGLGACAQKSTGTRTLTERERDSTLGKSVIPGGAAVTRALEVSDSATAAARRTDEGISGIK